MEIIGYTITILLIILTIFTPVYLVRKGHGLFKSLFISTPLCILFTVIGSWWGDVLPDIRLIMMGYDFNGMNEPERLINVSPELREEAMMLYELRFGIGWPLKAMFGIGYIVIPYILLFLGGATVWRKLRNKTPNKTSQPTPKSGTAEL